MKARYSLIAIILTLGLFSCQKDEFKIKQGKGSLHIDIGLFINVHDENSTLKSTQQTEDFRVTVYKSDGTEAVVFENASEIPETIELETGDYYVEVHSENNLPAAFENPYYYGVSDVFSINSNMHQSVLVTCELANTMVTVVYSDRIKGSFTDYTTTVSSALGSLVFLKDDNRPGYFQPLPLEIMVELTYLKPDESEGSRILSGSIPNPLAKKHYEIHVDASITDGMATFQIVLDETEPAVEIVDLTDDSDNTQNGAIGYGELLITEIMYDPSALADLEGEWFEICNNSDHTINLQNLILVRDDVNMHVITEPVELVPASYFVFERTDQATDFNGYIYGSDISLTNTGAVLAIFNEGSETDPGPLIFSVDYGGDYFPDCSGASLCLDPDLTHAANAVSGTSWCASTSAYGTGDLGTPGQENDDCNPQ